MVYIQWRNQSINYLVKYADEYWARHDIKTAPPWAKPVALFKPKVMPAPSPVGKYEQPDDFRLRRNWF